MNNIINEIGKKYQKLIAIKQSRSEIGKPINWLCRCDCGNHLIVPGTSLRRGNTKSCGCLGGGKLKDEIGNTYGKLTVLKKIPNDKANGAKWLCKCDCGNELIIKGIDLRRPYTKSCGCSGTNKSKRIDETGNTYGNLTVISLDDGLNKAARWLCECNCGNRVIKTGIALREGKTKSCGCLRTKRF